MILVVRKNVCPLTSSRASHFVYSFKASLQWAALSLHQTSHCSLEYCLMDSLTYNTTDELKNGEILATNNTFTPYHIFEHQASAHPSESVLQSKYSSKMIAFRGPGHFQHPLLSLQRYPRCFIEAWLLLLKSSALTVQSVQGNCLSGSSLSLDEVGAILMLKDMPHDQVLAWYGDSGLHGSFNSCPLSSSHQLWDSHTIGTRTHN